MRKNIEKGKGEKEVEVEISDDVASKKEYWDNYSILTTSYNKGREEGRAEGLVEGMEKGIEKSSIGIAKKMKLKGMSSDLIAEMTGLTINVIESL